MTSTKKILEVMSPGHDWPTDGNTIGTMIAFFAALASERCPRSLGYEVVKALAQVLLFSIL